MILRALLATAIASGALHSQTLTTASLAAAPEGRRLLIYLDANAKNALESGSGTAIVSGAIGFRYEGPTFTTATQINVAAKSETLTGGFGTALLSPGSGQAFNSGIVDLRTRTFGDTSCRVSGNRPWCRVGLHAYASASTSRWATEHENGEVTRTVDVPVTGGGVGAYYRFFGGTVGSSSSPQRVAMMLDVGFTTRHIGGDLADSPAVVRRILGDSDRTFSGAEVGLTLVFKEILAGLTYYKMSGNVPGFSNGQIVAGIAVQVSFIDDVFREIPR